MAEEAQNRVGAGATSKDGFPQYRKTSDDRHYYRIEAVDRFTEIQLIGSRSIEYHVIAVQYPERVRIAEMLEMTDARYVRIVEEEWAVARPDRAS
jgi:hypothetical protein